MRKALLMTFAALLLSSFIMPARAAEEPFERTIPLARGASFSLQNINGPVTITGQRVDVKGHPSEAIRAAAYWKRGARGHHENL